MVVWWKEETGMRNVGSLDHPVTGHPKGITQHTRAGPCARSRRCVDRGHDLTLGSALVQSPDLYLWGQ